MLLLVPLYKSLLHHNHCYNVVKCHCSSSVHYTNISNIVVSSTYCTKIVFIICKGTRYSRWCCSKSTSIIHTSICTSSTTNSRSTNSSTSTICSNTHTNSSISISISISASTSTSRKATTIAFSSSINRSTSFCWICSAKPISSGTLGLLVGAGFLHNLLNFCFNESVIQFLATYIQSAPQRDDSMQWMTLGTMCAIILSRWRCSWRVNMTPRQDKQL